jgi:imidazole glycerol-phosphate synthase subunit HisH
MTVIVIDYGMGNVASIVNMVRKAGGEIAVSADPALISKADKLILPGVGAFDNGIANLNQRGLVPLLSYRVLEHRVPILGLCLGVQLFTRCSEEGKLPGLGWIEADTRRFRFSREEEGLKVPHMGWNFIEAAKPAVLLNGLPPEPRFYFVHSYHLVCDDPADVLTWTTYGYRFASGIQRGNIWGTQFHPEKSHKFGLALLKNFLALS